MQESEALELAKEEINRMNALTTSLQAALDECDTLRHQPRSVHVLVPCPPVTTVPTSPQQAPLGPKSPPPPCFNGSSSGSTCDFLTEPCLRPAYPLQGSASRTLDLCRVDLCDAVPSLWPVHFVEDVASPPLAEPCAELSMSVRDSDSEVVSVRIFGGEVAGRGGPAAAPAPTPGPRAPECTIYGPCSSPASEPPVLPGWLGLPISHPAQRPAKWPLGHTFWRKVKSPQAITVVAPPPLAAVGESEAARRRRVVL